MAGSSSRAALVAGGAGFVGSHLVERLLTEGYRVIVIDNFMTGSRTNLTHLKENPRLTVMEVNVREPLRITEHLDEVYNLASPASPRHYQKDPIDTLLTNVVGTQNLLDLATEHSADYLQASTSEIYGDPTMHPQTEEYWGNVNPIGVRSCYDEGKRAAETLCFDYWRMRGTKVRVIRIFNTYGPRMAADDGRVVSNFIVQALNTEDITIYGDGSQTRSFQYVDDLVEGMRMVMSQESIGPFNIGNPDEYTILEFAQKITALVDGKNKIVYEPLPTDDPTRRKPDIARARLLGWEPKVPLEEGLRRTIAYFKSL